MPNKGVILCGGQGTRLRPVTLTTNKHLLPILAEPMILYPLRTLRDAGITDIMIITGGEHIGAFADFLGDGSEYGVSLTYRVQKKAGGIAEALALAAGFYEGYEDKVVAILGDNIYEPSFSKELQSAFTLTGPDEAVLFLKDVPDKERFGVATLSPLRMYPASVQSVVEKPKNPAPNGYAVTGCYIYPRNVFEVIDTLEPSLRGELEITDVNAHYVEAGRCKGFKTGSFWSDAGTPKSLLQVAIWADKNWG